MTDMDPTLFDRLSEELINSGDARPGMMMGFPCLKIKGHYYACKDKRSSALIIKLSEKRVNALIISGEALPFTPAGQLFSLWAVMEVFHENLWRGVLREARKLIDEG